MAFHQMRITVVFECGLCFVALVVLALISLGGSPASAQSAEEQELLLPPRPGLVATWTDGKQTVTLLESRLALRLQADQAPHPALASDRFTGRLAGVLYVQRPGVYRFRAEVRGAFQLKVGGELVLDCQSSGDEAHRVSGNSIELAYGSSLLEATFEKTGHGPAELRVFWQQEGSFEETVVPVALGHLERHETTELLAGQRAEAGHLLAAELRCTKCHAPRRDDEALALSVDRGPDLTGVGERTYSRWLYHWLERPHALRPGTAMPAMFGASETEQLDLYAAWRYLAAQGGPLPLNSEAAGANIAAAQHDATRGEMASTGCIACHALPGEASDPALRSLSGLGSKMPASAIRQRIADPDAHHRDTRMPDFQLADNHAELLDAITAYLAAHRQSDWETEPDAPPEAAIAERFQQLGGAKADAAMLDELPGVERWERLGKLVVQTRGCLACHELKEEGESLENRAPPAAGWSDLAPRLAAATEEGCLTASPLPSAPDFALGDEQRAALAEFIGSPAPIRSEAPIHLARMELERLGCTACHDRDGRPGRFGERITQFVPLGSDETLRDVAPPSLANIGEKLHLATLQAIIDGKARARPWMKLKMPLLSKHHLGDLAEWLLAADGLPPVKEKLQPLAATPEQLELGRQLIGRTGLNCVSCHDVRGEPSIGTRGPDLANVFQRVTSDWFHRWLLDPQRIEPGTRMPTVFFGGISAAPQYLDGDPDGQLAAMWAYLSQGRRMAMPITAPSALLVEGGENPHYEPGDRPILVRGFMPDVAGLRGIALGYPSGTHFAFDSQECRLTAMWQGDFVSVGGWFDNGRGTAHDNAARPLAELRWQAVATAPLEIAGSQTAARSRFRGCWVDDQRGTFAWELTAADGQALKVEESPQPLPDGIGRAGLRRTFRVASATKQSLALHVANMVDDGKVQFFGNDGRPLLSAADAPTWAMVRDEQKQTWLIGLVDRASSGEATRWQVETGDRGQSLSLAWQSSPEEPCEKQVDYILLAEGETLVPQRLAAWSQQLRGGGEK